MDDARATARSSTSPSRAPAGSGTSYLTFELNRDDRLWDNGRARVPCRRDGDLLITFQPHGNDVTLSVQSWKTDSTDPSTGCAKTGSLRDEAELTAERRRARAR